MKQVSAWPGLLDILNLPFDFAQNDGSYFFEEKSHR